MLRKMKFRFVYKSRATSAWPACAHTPLTPSVRENTAISDSDDSAVASGMRSDRLIFQPEETSSIVGIGESREDYFSFKPMAIDSRNPVVDFRASMAEMVEAHGVDDWDRLEELLSCYLRVNRNENLGYIVEAFVDLVLHLASDSDQSSMNSAIDERRSSLSFSSSTNLSI